MAFFLFQAWLASVGRAAYKAAMALREPAFVVSLDFELYWGLRDKRTLASYRENLLGVHRVIPRLLERFDHHGIRATWATVGFLMLRDADDLRAQLPSTLPGYTTSNLCPYRYALQSPSLPAETHFAPALVERILRANGQELATHTFSHFYCLEHPRSLEAFRADLELAIACAKERFGQKVRSLVFPRNQYTAAHVQIAGELGIETYRGNPETWMYAPRPEDEESLLRRGARLADAWLPISRPLGFFPDVSPTGPRNVPASRFLRPWSRRLGFAEPLRVRRIVSEMRAAAETGRSYHLWWHPHNFGKNQDENLSVLSEILRAFDRLHALHGMRSKSMAEFAASAAR